jgi:hypothetical protein
MLWRGRLISSAPIQGFISYSHRNKDALERLVVHLAAIERMSTFRFWYDKRKLLAGDFFDREIEDAIERSSFFVLLVSPDFFASDYIFNNELPAIISRIKKSDSPCVPVILTQCLWPVWLEGILSVPTPPPLDEWNPIDRGFHEANQAIFRKLTQMYELPIATLASNLERGKTP